MPRAEAARTTAICNLRDLQLLEDEWAALWRRDPLATPFQSPQWLIPWARSFGAHRLLAVAVRHGQSLVALVPLYVYVEPATGRRQLLLLGAGTSDYLGCVAAAETGREEMERVAQEFLSQATAWDVAHFSQLRDGSPLLELPSICPQICASTSEPCSRVLLSHALPAKLRDGIAYYRRRAKAIGELQCVVASSPAMAAEFFESLVRLHGERWKAAGGPGVLADPRVLAHHRAAVPLLYAAGILRMYSLQLNGQTIAAAYALVDHPGAAERSFYYYLGGFDPKFHALSPGTLLLASLVEAARDEGAAVVDLLRGQEAFKKFWGAEAIVTHALHALSPGEAK